jgi:hypothetical protein
LRALAAPCPPQKTSALEIRRYHNFFLKIQYSPHFFDYHLAKYLDHQPVASNKFGKKNPVHSLRTGKAGQLSFLL